MKFNKYINIPYKHQGRDFNGCDCLGLARLILNTETNAKIGDYSELKYDKNWYKKHNHIIDNIKNDWIEVTKPYKIFDILLFWTVRQGYCDHIGLYVGDNKFIHIQEDHVSQIDKLELFWKEALYKAIRYKDGIKLNG